MKVKYDGPPTTVIMRHIPSDYTREQLLEVVNAAGFQKDYDILSIPIDLVTEIGHGFASINFTTHEQAEQFKEHFHGFNEWQVPHDKACETSWSDTLKGYVAIVERYRDSPLMHESVPDKFKPAVYKDGVRIPFPAPTKTIKPPRPRTRHATSATQKT